jgi:hypothetical protein
LGDSASGKLVQQKKELIANGNLVAERIGENLEKIETSANPTFLSLMEKKIDVCGPAYIDVIQSLDSTEAQLGTQWLQQIVDRMVGQMLDLFPSLR